MYNILYTQFDHTDRDRIFSALVALKILIESGHTFDSAKGTVIRGYKLTDSRWIETEKLYNANPTKSRAT